MNAQLYQRCRQVIPGDPMDAQTQLAYFNAIHTVNPAAGVLPAENILQQTQGMQALGQMGASIDRILSGSDDRKLSDLIQAANTNDLQRVYVALCEYCKVLQPAYQQNLLRWMVLLEPVLNIRTAPKPAPAPQPVPQVSADPQALAAYAQAMGMKNAANSERDFQQAAAAFLQLGNFQDASKQVGYCRQLAENARKDKILEEARQDLTGSSVIVKPTAQRFQNTLNQLLSISDWRDAGALISACRVRIAQLSAEEAAAQQQARTASAKRSTCKRLLAILCPIGAVTLLALIILLSCCWHEWIPANCIRGELCIKCEKIRGEALGHSWMEATCVEPKTCAVCGETEGNPLGHNWKSGDCVTDQVCFVCGTVGKEAPGHDWISATCLKAEYCAVCQALGSQLALGHDYTDETDTEPATCQICSHMLPMEYPDNGEVFIGKNSSRFSKLTVTTSYQACYVKIKDQNGEDIRSFFIQPNSTASMGVPSGKYYVYFASGDQWYGTTHLFGEDTRYSKDDELKNFSVYEYTYTLRLTIGGNFDDTEIDEDEFK